MKAGRRFPFNPPKPSVQGHSTWRIIGEHGRQVAHAARDLDLRLQRRSHSHGLRLRRRGPPSQSFFSSRSGTVGALLAVFTRAGGDATDTRAGDSRCELPRLPPLQTAQGRGTHCIDGAREIKSLSATRQPVPSSSPATAAAHTAESRRWHSTALPAAYRCGPRR